MNKSLTYQELVGDFLAQHAAKTTKSILGAAVHSRFDLLPRLWPNARFIHMLRDPRDVARSAIFQGWVGHVYFGARYWLEAEQRWSSLVTALLEHQRTEVRYEELVYRPEAELSKLCEFLGVAYDPAMLSYDRDSTYSKPNPALAGQ